MITFISPTKNMKPITKDYPMTLPAFAPEAEELLEILQEYNDEDIMNIMKVNAKLAVQNQTRFREIRFDLRGYPALFAYVGLAFQSMHLHTWDHPSVMFAQDHLRILSGFYGVNRPLDSIYPYRLEMQAQGLSAQIDNLYSYWSDSLIKEMRKECTDGIYINLASKEYSQAILPYLKEKEHCIHIDFQMIKDGKRRVVATHAKMARGAMVAYIMRHQIDDPAQLKEFHQDDWQYDEDTSTRDHYVFVKR